MQDYRYFIRDCENRIVGNPKGYRTFKGANIQANHGKANRTLWNNYALRTDTNNNRVWSILSEGV